MKSKHLSRVAALLAGLGGFIFSASAHAASTSLWSWLCGWPHIIVPGLGTW